MDTQKLRYSVLCCFFLTLLSGQQVVQGRSASRHHHRISKLFVFGDSYADTGNAMKAFPSWHYPYGITFPVKPAGRFSDGRVLTDYVAKFIGVRSPIPYRWRKYGIPLLRYGMNFAVGGAGVFQTLYPVPNITTQIDFFQQLIRDNVFGRSDLESSVALVSLGGNDYGAYNGSFQGMLSFIPKVVKQLTVDLKRIHDLGVKKVAVITVEPFGCLPQSTIRQAFQKCNETENSQSKFHNLLLKKAVAKLNNEAKGSAFVILDLYDSFMSVFEYKRKNQVNTDFENPLKPCCIGMGSSYFCGSVDENGAKKYTLCEDPKSAFFWDIIHPTQAGWDAVYSTLQNKLKHLL